MTQTAPENAGSYKKKHVKVQDNLTPVCIFKQKAVMTTMNLTPSPFRMIQMMSLKHSS